VDQSAATTGCVAVILRPATSPRRAWSSGIVTVDAASTETASAPAAANESVADSTSTLTVVRRSEVLVTTRLRAPVPPGTPAIVADVAADAEGATQSAPALPVTRPYVAVRPCDAVTIAVMAPSPLTNGASASWRVLFPSTVRPREPCRGDPPLGAVERHVDRALCRIGVRDEERDGMGGVSHESHESLLDGGRAARSQP